MIWWRCVRSVELDLDIVDVVDIVVIDIFDLILILNI